MSGRNFIRAIVDAGRRHPERLALAVPQANGDVERTRYGELLAEVARTQSALTRLDLVQGDRVLLAARPGRALYVLVIALLGLGLVPVLIDSGMTAARKRAALKASGARHVIGTCTLLRFWWLLPALWHLRRLAVDGAALGVGDLRRHAEDGAREVTCLALPDEAHGLLTFTSGSTGAPKGADRTHGSLIAQHEAIRAHWPDRDDDTDLPCFPVLVLHNLCCGIRTVLPDADLAAPGRVDGARVLAQLSQEAITRVAGAPAYVERLCTAAEAAGQTFAGVRSLVIGGSTVSTALARRCCTVFPQAEVRIVYGSTEAEPIADVSAGELLRDGDSAPGHLVGTPADMATVCIVATDRALASEADVQAATLPAGEIGEILVAGAHVLKRYLDNEAATRASKIARADGTVWHRTGDAGYRDAAGRLWLCGRVGDALQVDGTTRYPFEFEKTLDALPGVRRSALLMQAGRPLLVLAGRPDAALLRDTLARLDLLPLPVAYVPALPVDGRHNSKIDRPALRAALAAGRLQSTEELA